MLTGLINLPAARYAGDAELRTATDRLLEAARALPGVEAAGVSTTIPFSGNSSDSVILAEGYQMSPGESVISPSYVSVSDGYFETMGVRLITGRWFSDDDVEGRQRVIVIDDRLARRFWPNGDAVGKRMYLPASASEMFTPPPADQMLTVVGVIAEMRLRGGGGWEPAPDQHRPVHIRHLHRRLRAENRCHDTSPSVCCRCCLIWFLPSA